MAETIPGGYYIGADGTAHDANGKKIPILPVPPKQADGVEPASDEPEPTAAEVALIEKLNTEALAEAAPAATDESKADPKGKGSKGSKGIKGGKGK